MNKLVNLTEAADLLMPHLSDLTSKNYKVKHILVKNESNDQFYNKRQTISPIVDTNRKGMFLP